jgi:hypothetical protein
MNLTFYIDPEVAKALVTFLLVVMTGCSWSIKGKFKRK